MAALWCGRRQGHTHATLYEGTHTPRCTREQIRSGALPTNAGTPQRLDGGGGGRGAVLSVEFGCRSIPLETACTDGDFYPTTLNDGLTWC